MHRYNIYSINHKGHHEDYAKVFSALVSARVIKSKYLQLMNIFSSHPIIFLDGDRFHLLYFPFIIFRSLFGFKNYMLSIRTERVIDSKLQRLIKLPIYKLLKSITSTRIISIHKESIREAYYEYITDFIYDLQYWDLKFLNIIGKKPIELADINFNNTIAVVGEFNDKKSRNELLEYLKFTKDTRVNFIFAGKILNDDLKLLHSYFNCTVIDRYIDNDELYYIYEHASIIWCFYSEDTNRPSGIFGRAIQLGKPALIRKNGYLHKNNANYPYSIKINNLSELDDINYNFNKVQWLNEKDSSQELIEIFNN